jgi:hypothetical protein
MRKFLFILLFTSSLNVYCQDTTLKVKIDTSNLTLVSNLRISTFTFLSNEIYLTHSPEKIDNRNYRNLKYLLSNAPNSKNYEKYFSLACSLWELGKIKEAEKLFLNIITSKEKFYTSDYNHSSDVAGDTSKNIYGYGSFTTNYKNNSAIYLTKINLEKKNYKTALKYLELAVKKYKAKFTCGTGYHSQKKEYDFYYATCYEGLGENKKNIDLLLSEDYTKNDEILIRAIRKVYTKAQIFESLENGLKYMKCNIDKKPSYGEETRYGANNVKTTKKTKYFSGSATMKLFNKIISISPPSSSPRVLTKKDFENEFKESSLYKELMEEA